MVEKEGTCFILDGHVIKKYLEGNDKNMDKMMNYEIDFYRKNKKMKMMTPIQAFMFALFNAEKIDGERLKKLVDRVSFNFVMKDRIIELDYLRDEK